MCSRAVNLRIVIISIDVGPMVLEIKNELRIKEICVVDQLWKWILVSLSLAIEPPAKKSPPPHTHTHTGNIQWIISGITRTINQLLRVLTPHTQISNVYHEYVTLAYISLK